MVSDINEAVNERLLAFEMILKEKQQFWMNLWGKGTEKFARTTMKVFGRPFSNWISSSIRFHGK